MKDIFQERIIPYKLQNMNPFQGSNVKTVYNGTEILSFRGSKTWAIVPESIQNAISLREFKAKIKQWEPKGCECRLCRKCIQKCEI